MTWVSFNTICAGVLARLEKEDATCPWLSISSISLSLFFFPYCLDTTLYHKDLYHWGRRREIRRSQKEGNFTQGRAYLSEESTGYGASIKSGIAAQRS